jgi:hypothetical protein
MDALLNRLAAVKVYWDRRDRVYYREYFDVPEMAIPQLIRPSQPNEQVDLVVIEVSSESTVISTEPHPLTGLPTEVEQVKQSYYLKVRHRITTGQPTVVSIPPEEVGISGDQRSPNLDDSRFVYHEMLVMRSELIEQGYDPGVVSQLPSTVSSDLSPQRRESITTVTNSSHESTDYIKVYECYLKLDRDGDGIAEQLRVVLASDYTVLSIEEYDSVAIKTGVAITYPHKWRGISLFDRLYQVQDSNTSVIRSIENGVALATRQRIGAVTNRVNLDDLLNSTWGGVVRMNSPDALVTVPNPEVPISAFRLIELNNEKRGEGGG